MPEWRHEDSDFDYFVDYACGQDMYSYEITVTLNPMIYTRISGDSLGPNILHDLQSWLIPSYDYNPYRTSVISIVKEYTKARMPHFHCCINSTDAIDPIFRNNVVKALQRKYGRSTFKDVIDTNSYLEYMAKDLKNNLQTHNFSHFIVSQFI